MKCPESGSCVAQVSSPFDPEIAREVIATLLTGINMR